MTNGYKQIQITNSEIGNIAENAYLPLGRVTRRINAPYNCCNTFTVTSSTADTVSINDPGFYKITYSLTASAADTGDVSVALVLNGNTIYTVSQYVSSATGSVNITLPYTIRVYAPCSANTESCPVSVQLQNTGIALTGVSSNIIVEKL